MASPDGAAGGWDSPEPWADMVDCSATTTVDDDAPDSPEPWADDGVDSTASRKGHVSDGSPELWADDGAVGSLHSTASDGAIDGSPELWADGGAVGSLLNTVSDGPQSDGSPEPWADTGCGGTSGNADADDGVIDGSPEPWADDGVDNTASRDGHVSDGSPELWADDGVNSTASRDGHVSDGSPELWADGGNADGTPESPELWVDDARWAFEARVAARRPDSPAPWASPAPQPTAADATTEWTTADLGGAGVRVYRHGQPHVDVRRSVALDADGELGLFAATEFCNGATIGVYTGSEVTPGTEGPYVAKVRPDRRGPAVWIDGRDAGPPYVQKINDPRGTGLRANARLLQSGRVVAARRIPRGAEILMRYQ